MTKHFLVRVFCCVSLVVFTSTAGAALKVDISPDNGRKDIQTPRWENWLIKDGQQKVSGTFGSVTVTLRNPSGSKMGATMWKGGIDTGATVTTDGVTVSQGGGLEMTLHGLTPGPHTLVTIHNAFDKPLDATCTISIDGQVKASGVKPTFRVTNDVDAANTFVQFDAKAGQDVVVSIKPDTADGMVVLNGFQIDTTNPAKLALKPFPLDTDEHAVEEPALAWTPAKDAVAHQIYLGSSAEAVANATPASPEYRGSIATAKFPTSGLSHMNTYYWRVDEVAADKTVTKGDVWSFRVRHLAFPGAEGYGRYAIGGRGGRVMEVTTLDDYDPKTEQPIPGSLRAAVETVGPRIVVFRVGGAIKLKEKLVITNPYISIEGQTAPGDGIAVHNFTFGAYTTHDVIIRYMRIRVGDESGQTMDGSGFGSCNNCIMDHCSVAWSIDEAFSSRSAKNITLQRSIITEALNMSVHIHYVGTGKGHSFAGSISGDIGSFLDNLVANCAGRNWSLAGGYDQSVHFAGRLDIRNNVVYNWAHRTNDGGVKALNLVANYYIPGQASQVFHLLMPDFGSVDDPQQYYLADNVMEGHPQYNPDNWANGSVNYQEESLQKIKLSQLEVTKLIKLDQPFCDPHAATLSAKDAYQSVLADVGANYPKYDSVDARAVQNVLTRSTTFKGKTTGIPGIIDSQEDVGGYPVMKGGAAPVDSDHDGIPDDWEKAHGLNPNDPADARKLGQDGYTNIEIYVNSLPLQK